MHGAAQAEPNYAVDNERTSIDPLPQLGDDSGRNWKAEADQVFAVDPPEYDSQEDIKTRAMPPPLPTESTTSTASTAPTGVPSLRGGQIPTIYYVIAVLSVVIIVLIAWLIAR